MAGVGGNSKASGLDSYYPTSWISAAQTSHKLPAGKSKVKNNCVSTPPAKPWFFMHGLLQNTVLDQTLVLKRKEELLMVKRRWETLITIAVKTLA
jgi:hypothetical protein